MPDHGRIDKSYLELILNWFLINEDLELIANSISCWIINLKILGKFDDNISHPR